MQLELNGPKFILPSFLETWHPDIKKKKKKIPEVVFSNKQKPKPTLLKMNGKLNTVDTKNIFSVPNT